METAVVSTAAACPRSLLSRVTPLKYDVSSRESAGTTAAKRRISDEGDERSPKRRRSNQECPTDRDAHYAPWLKSRDLDNHGTREERLHGELLRFVEYITPSKQEREAHRALVSRIETLLRTRWSDAQVTVFGSSATGLELSGGDVDLVISFNSPYDLPDLDKKRRLAAIGDVLRRSGMTSWVNRIFGAKVPIIKFVTTEELGEVSIDISIRDDGDTGVRAIPLVKQYLADMPALRPLILAVKAFLSLCDLNDASQGTLSSYAITLMCISFLQRNPTRRPQRQLDDPCTEKSLGLLLMDFFRHYGYDFSYATHYISVSDGGIFPKKSKNWELKPNNPAVLGIQCILNPENNITRGCGKIALIVETFKEALYALQNKPSSSTSDDASLLRPIYEVSEEDDTKRRLLDESVDSGAFSRFVAACSAELGRRTVGGAVPLSTRAPTQSNHDRNERSLLMRLGPCPVQVLGNGQYDTIHDVQQLPLLRWRNDYKHQQTAQGTIDVGPMKQEKHLAHRSMPNRTYHNKHNSNLNSAIRNHLAPQRSQRTG